MPKNVDIQAGRRTGAPPNWDPERDGPCAAISVNYGAQGVYPALTTAWQLSTAERVAMSYGGHLFLQILGQERHPVICFWTQDKDGQIVGDLTGPYGAPAMREPRRLSVHDFVNDYAMSTEGADYEPSEFERTLIEDAIEGYLADLQVARPAVIVNGHSHPAAVLGGDIVEVPIQTLDSIAAEAQAAAALDRAAGRYHGQPVAPEAEPSEHRHANAAICPRCEWPNDTPLESLKPDWQQAKCQRCHHPFEFRGVATGPGSTQDGDFEIASRRIPAEPEA